MRKLLLTACLLVGATATNASEDLAEKRAAFQWKMNCQGCHQANGEGSLGGAPDMRGIVARFLDVDGGRAYLGQVPGVAYAPLNDNDLAILVNWLLKEYDGEHLKPGFVPYTAKEIGELRQRPLVDEATVVRTKLVAALRELEDRKD